MLAYNKCICGNKEDEEEEELDMIDKNLRSVIKNLNAFSTKLTYIESMINITEAKFRENGYNYGYNCHNADGYTQCNYKSIDAIDPKYANYTIRKLYYQRKFLIEVQYKVYQYYLDKFFNYLI